MKSKSKIQTTKNLCSERETIYERERLSEYEKQKETGRSRKSRRISLQKTPKSMDRRIHETNRREKTRKLQIQMNSSHTTSMRQMIRQKKGGVTRLGMRPNIKVLKR